MLSANRILGPRYRSMVERSPVDTQVVSPIEVGRRHGALPAVNDGTHDTTGKSGRPTSGERLRLSGLDRRPSRSGIHRIASTPSCARSQIVSNADVSSPPNTGSRSPAPSNLVSPTSPPAHGGNTQAGNMSNQVVLHSPLRGGGWLSRCTVLTKHRTRQGDCGALFGKAPFGIGAVSTPVLIESDQVDAASGSQTSASTQSRRR
jgi:hypothetical protein